MNQKDTWRIKKEKKKEDRFPVIQALFDYTALYILTWSVFCLLSMSGILVFERERRTEKIRRDQRCILLVIVRVFWDLQKKYM